MMNSQSFFLPCRKLSSIGLVIVCAVTLTLQPRTATAGSRGWIAGAVVGGIAAAIIASQIANAAKPQPGAKPVARKPKAAKTRDVAQPKVATDNQKSDDPFAGVKPTMTTRVSAPER